jgi:hypothetical protein
MRKGRCGGRERSAKDEYLARCAQKVGGFGRHFGFPATGMCFFVFKKRKNFGSGGLDDSNDIV